MHKTAHKWVRFRVHKNRYFLLIPYQMAQSKLAFLAPIRNHPPDGQPSILLCSRLTEPIRNRGLQKLMSLSNSISTVVMGCTPCSGHSRLEMQVCFGPSDKESGRKPHFHGCEFSPLCGPFYRPLNWGRQLL